MYTTGGIRVLVEIASFGRVVVPHYWRHYGAHGAHMFGIVILFLFFGPSVRKGYAGACLGVGRLFASHCALPVLVVLWWRKKQSVAGAPVLLLQGHVVSL